MHIKLLLSLTLDFHINAFNGILKVVVKLIRQIVYLLADGKPKLTAHIPNQVIWAFLE